MNFLIHALPSPDHAIACPKTKIVTFIVLTFLFSSIFWFLISWTSPVAENSFLLTIYSLGAMWCPAFAAIVTRLAFQRNLEGFGIYPGKPVFLAAGILIPVVAGLLMFGLAWLSGVAPFNPEGAAGILTISFVPALLFVLLFSCVAAAGSEFGGEVFSCRNMPGAWILPPLCSFQGQSGPYGSSQRCSLGDITVLVRYDTPLPCSSWA